MDTGNGNFKMLEENEYNELFERKPTRTDIFKVGEIVTIRDSRFRINKITPKKMTLRLLPRI